MPVLKAEADLLTNDSFSKVLVETLITRGAKDIMGRVPFQSFQGSAFTFSREKAIPDTPSLQDPYGDTLPSGVGSYQRIAVEALMLARNADTAVIDTLGKSNIMNLRYQDLVRASKRLSEDFLTQMVYGRHDDTGAAGDINLKGIEHWISFNEADFPDQVIYNTTAGTAADYANAQPLSLNLVDDLLSRYQGEEFDMLLSDRATMVAFKDILNAQGGNRGGDFMSKNFGAPYAYNGTPWHVFDKVGSTRQTQATVFGTATPAANATAASNTIVVNEPRFPGFTDRDIGKTISVGGTSCGVIVGINSVLSVETSAIAADLTGAVVVGPAPVIYAVRFDEADGFSALYHNQSGQEGKNGEYLGAIAGFKVDDLKRTENAEKLRYRLSWYGNFVAQSPYCLAVASHFTR